MAANQFGGPLNPQDPETIRQYEVAKEFISLHPEFEPTMQNNDKLLDWMEFRDMKMTLEGMEIAYKAVFQGDPEPKVMSPDLFFSKVEPTQYIPKSSPQSFIDMGRFKIAAWKPMGTGLTGAPTDYVDVDVDISELSKQMINLANEWVVEPSSPVVEKPVAAMPSSWYSDVVEIQTTRRIKDND